MRFENSTPVSIPRLRMASPRMPTDGDGKACNAAEEYSQLQAEAKRDGRPRCKEGKAFFNAKKNRYKDVVPVDETRVRLDTRDGAVGSDYINANLVQYPGDDVAYIAAQAPLPTTMTDFWRMVWEQESGVIVMLTNNVERNRIKAHPYIPAREGETCRFGGVTVSLVRSTSFHGMNVRSIRIHVQDKKERNRSSLTASTNSYFLGQQQQSPMDPPSASTTDARGPRLVYHIQYCGWPDFGVPGSTEGVQEVMRLMHTCLDCSREKGLNGPAVVHCSAGIGRTGTFISADIAERLISGNQKCSIPSIVSQLRMQRYGMVQTADQYVFIYQILHDWLARRIQPVVEGLSSGSTDEDSVAVDPAIAMDVEEEEEDLSFASTNDDEHHRQHEMVVCT